MIKKPYHNNNSKASIRLYSQTVSTNTIPGFEPGNGAHP